MSRILNNNKYNKLGRLEKSDKKYTENTTETASLLLETHFPSNPKPVHSAVDCTEVSAPEIEVMVTPLTVRRAIETFAPNKAPCEKIHKIRISVEAAFGRFLV